MRDKIKNFSHSKALYCIILLGVILLLPLISSMNLDNIKSTPTENNFQVGDKVLPYNTLGFGKILFVISGLLYHEKIVTTYISNPIIQLNTSKDYLVNPEDILKIKSIAIDNVFYKEYKLHEYDCTQFSKRLVYLLENEGYKTQCTAGNNWAFDYTNHTWVSVWVNDIRIEIEATSGEILSPEEYSTYEVGWENKCW